MARSELNYVSVTSKFLFFPLPLILFFGLGLIYFSAVIGSSSETGCNVPWANSVESLLSKGNICHLAPSFDIPVPARLPELILQRK